MRLNGVILVNRFFYEDVNIRVEHKYDFPMNQDQCFLHTHLNAELYYFLSGITKVHIDDSVYEASPGDVFLIKPNEPHYFEVATNKPYERIVINFDPRLFENFDKDKYILHCFYDRENGQKNQYRSSDFSDKSYSILFSDMVKTQKNHSVNLYANLFLILKKIADIFNSDIVMESPTTNSMDSAIIRYVNDHLEKPLNVGMICQHFFIGRSKLNQIFKHNTGLSPWEYITVKRLSKAQRLLADGYLATKIYELCGFDNYSTFYRAYVKYYGSFPSYAKVPKHKNR